MSEPDPDQDPISEPGISAEHEERAEDQAAPAVEPMSAHGESAAQPSAPEPDQVPTTVEAPDEDRKEKGKKDRADKARSAKGRKAKKGKKGGKKKKKKK
jgi:hypothetical protein